MGNYGSLIKYISDPIVNLTITSQIILGGLGFYVLSDLTNRLSGAHKRITFHTKIVIITTIVLIVIGTVMIFIFEHNNPLTIGNYSIGTKIMASYFQSVTARTAGFSTVPIGLLTNATLLFIIALMYIVAS